MGIIKTVKLPRKLKVGFSNSPANVTHATFRDLGFVAKENGTFDVYSAARQNTLPAPLRIMAKPLYFSGNLRRRHELQYQHPLPDSAVS